MRLTEIRTALDHLSLYPSKNLGQNFLHDANLARTIACAALPERVPFAVEIGPGLGSLTKPLLERCDHLLLIEKDARLAEWLRKHLPADRVTVECADAIHFDWRTLLPFGPFPLAGNLPYYATSPILRNFLALSSPVTRATFVVQDEFATRLAAKPNHADYSALTVRIQRLWAVRRERPLPPSVFYPIPGVDSSLVTLERHLPRTYPPMRQALFDEIVQRGFSQRRKQLRALLGVSPAVWIPWCDSHGIPSTVRAENLSVTLWDDLARTLDSTATTEAQCEDEAFDVVNKSNVVIGQKPRSIVHAQNLLHRAAHILVFNPQGEVLLQKRSAWKDRAPLLWDSSAAGHLEPGESYRAAAQREAEEELGVTLTLNPLGKLPARDTTGYEFVEVFTASHEGPFTLAPAEIEDAVFFSPSLIETWMRQRPQDFAPAFPEVWELMKKCIPPPDLRKSDKELGNF